MTKSITKVKKKSSDILRKTVNPAGWHALLADIEKDIRVLKGHRDIVKRKIESGEAWPGNKKAGMDAKSIPA